MSNKLWEALNSVEEHFIDLDGIRQHLNFAIDSDSSKSELESAIIFVTRLLERFENDLDNKLQNVWKAYREEKGIPEPNFTNQGLNYSEIIKSQDI